MKDRFVVLYDLFFNDVYRYVYSKVGSSWDTDDIVSEVFRKAYERFASLKENSNAKAWLITIARNTVIDFYRKKKDSLPGDDIERILITEPFEEKLAFEDDLICLQKVLASLPEEDHEFINLKYFAELKYREIEAVVGKSEDLIKTRVFRTIKKMSILMKNCLEGVNKRG